MSKQRIGVELSVVGEALTVEVAAEDRKVYHDRRAHRGVAPELPARVAYTGGTDVSRASAFPSQQAHDALEVLQLEASDVVFQYAAVVQFKLRDDNLTVEYDAPGSGAPVAGTREDIEARMLADFGLHLDLRVLTLDNPKLTRSIVICEDVRLDEATPPT